MKEGIRKDWTPKQEERFKNLLANIKNFATRHLIMTIRDLLKYDLRTKAGKNAIARARLRLATASNDDLAQIVVLETISAGGGKIDMDVMGKRLKAMREARDNIIEKGIKRSAIEL